MGVSDIWAQDRNAKLRGNGGLCLEQDTCLAVVALASDISVYITACTK